MSVFFFFLISVFFVAFLMGLLIEKGRRQHYDVLKHFA